MPPTLKKWGHIGFGLSVCMYACMYLCMYVCMYVCTYVCICVCMYVCMYEASRYRLETSCMDSIWKIS